MNCAKYASILVAILLTGCATVRQVDNDVLTQSTLKSMPVAGYRFERLPSQQSPPEVQNQTALEFMAEQALALVGLRRDDAKPGYSMLIAAHVRRDMPYGWNDPWYGAGRMGIGFVWGGGGGGAYGGGMFWGPSFPAYSPPLFHREVSLIMRDLATGQVVYETRAAHDSPWTDDNNIFPLMFQAALSGFPKPPSERRLVNLTLQPTPAPKQLPTPAKPSTAPAAATSPLATPMPTAPPGATVVIPAATAPQR